MGDDLFFIVRGGAVWACWLSGKPAVNLGAAGEVDEAMKQFLKEQCPTQVEPPKAPEGDWLTKPSVPPTPSVGRSPATVAPPPPKPVLKERAAERHEITIRGRIFTSRGSRDVTILDLSETGCQFHAPMCPVRIGDRLTIKIGPVGPVEATVRWSRDDSLGVQFNSPLYPSVLEHIRDHFDLRRR